MKNTILLLVLLLFSLIKTQAQDLYFPPDDFEAEWETVSPEALGWCANIEDSLYEFLDDRDTKGFIILKDGKIVVEKYFGTFTKDSIWYWASVAKSMTAFMSGLAQEEGLIDINAPVADYLGEEWTECAETDGQITYLDLMTMTSGLDDAVETRIGNCTEPRCFQCLTTPGERWAYHNGPYWRTHDILGLQDGTNINRFTRRILMDKVGMRGLWLDHLFVSRPRDMARFGLLMLAKGTWNDQTLMNDDEYFKAMISPSQELNKSYGYLWWLNGQESFMAPRIQRVFEGPLITSAPEDMIAALGKNDQKIYICPSENLVVIRMGENAADASLASSFFDNELWQVLNDFRAGCDTDGDEGDQPLGFAKNENTEPLHFYPNPSQTEIRIDRKGHLSVLDVQGRTIDNTELDTAGKRISVQHLPRGIYFLKLQSKEGVFFGKLIRE